MDTAKQNRQIWFTVAVAALGYFVDIYDIQLFNVVSKKSLIGIGITDKALIDQLDYTLFLWQMFGMLAGGLLWGVLGDKLGRRSVLFGSIITYSLANIANGFVTTPEQYSVLRFIAGFGLAGELGAAITLVSELMTKENRGYGTMVVVAMGALGAVAAATVSVTVSWQWAYFIGGGLGLLLLLLRVSTFESGMFETMKSTNVSRGNIAILFNNRQRFTKLLYCTLLGLPIWFAIGILIKFSPSITQINAATTAIALPQAVMYCYLGLSFGDFVCGWLSQVFRSRKRVIVFYLFAFALMSGIILYVKGISPSLFYLFAFLLGSSSGYWALFVTVASEQFGTNIRATATSLVPNFVRGAVIPITLSFKALEKNVGTIESGVIVGAVCFLLALVSLWQLPETFGKDLNYNEE
jgi:MFS transporter, putative metabolite:H+ symporter